MPLCVFAGLVYSGISSFASFILSWSANGIEFSFMYFVTFILTIRARVCVRTSVCFSLYEYALKIYTNKGKSKETKILAKVNLEYVVIAMSETSHITLFFFINSHIAL